MNSIPVPHPSWCSQDDCYTRQNGQVVHRCGGESFIDEGIATVRLIDRGNGIEVQLEAGGSFVVTEVTLYPELAVELGEALIDHGRRAGAVTAVAE